VEVLVNAIKEKKVVEIKDYVSSYAGQTLDYRVEPSGLNLAKILVFR